MTTPLTSEQPAMVHHPPPLSAGCGQRIPVNALPSLEGSPHEAAVSPPKSMWVRTRDFRS